MELKSNSKGVLTPIHLVIRAKTPEIGNGLLWGCLNKNNSVNRMDLR